MDVPQIAPSACTSEDRVPEVTHTFIRDGFASCEPRHGGTTK